MSEEAQLARVARLAPVLNDPQVTVGAIFDIGAPVLMQGNFPCEGPQLHSVMIDDHGRLWKELHQNGKHHLVCVLDIRQLSAAVDAGMSDAA